MGIVAFAVYIAMRHILKGKAVSLGGIVWNLQTARHHAATIERLAVRVCHLHTVNIKEIVVETLCLWVGSAGPYAILAFLHVIAFAEVYLHLLGIGRLNAEHDTVVGQHTWVLFTTDVP